MYFYCESNVFCTNFFINTFKFKFYNDELMSFSNLISKDNHP